MKKVKKIIDIIFIEPIRIKDLLFFLNKYKNYKIYDFETLPRKIRLLIKQ